MERSIRFLCALFALMLLMSGCALEETPEAVSSPEPSPTLIPQKEDFEDVEIALVDGEPIFLSEFIPIFEYYRDTYAMYYGADFSDETLLHSFQDNILGMMIESKVILLQAAKEGITLSQEDLDAARETARETYDAVLDSYRAQAAQAEDPESEAMALFEARLAEDGLTPESYLAQLEEDVGHTMLADALTKQVFDTVSLTEAEAKAQFEEDLAAAKEQYTANPSAFESAQSNYEAGNGLPPFYTPEGFRRVKHILIKITEERTEKEALALAEELADRARDGEDFDALMAEYGEDPGMKMEPNMSLGYLTHAGTSFVPEFLEAAMALEEVGDLTEPVKSDHGFHVIRLESFLESGELAFADVKESYMATLLEFRQEQAYLAALTEWKAAAEIVTYEDRMRDTGSTEE